MIDWTDIDSLSFEQVTDLLEIIHDSHLAKEMLESGDPRVFIIHDSSAQRKVFDRINKEYI